MRNQSTFKDDKPILFLVGTPIGNLADISYRALEVLEAANYILCEDTRTSKKFLDKYKIKKPLISLHKYNEKQRFDEIKQLLVNKNNLAIISDAGCPTISDPGALLVHQILDENICNVTSVNVGPAYIHAIVASGFTQTKNYFHGFIQAKSPASKHNEIEEIIQKHLSTTISFYESVHRIKNTISVLRKIIPQSTQVLVARELTKINEQFIQGTINEVDDFINSEGFVEKGEFVVVINNSNFDTPKQFNENDLFFEIDKLISGGIKLKDACLIVANKFGVSKNEIYNKYVKLK